MPVDDVRLSQQQLALLRWIAEQVGILANFDDPEQNVMRTDSELAKAIKQARDKTIRWSSNKYFGPYRTAYLGISDTEISSLSRSLKKLEDRGFINRLGDGRIKLTSSGHDYLVKRFLGPARVAELMYEDLKGWSL